MEGEDLIVLLETLRNTLIARATGEAGDPVVYRRGRSVLLKDLQLATVTPRWINSCRDLSDFWGLIQPMFPTYKERRDWLREQFEPILDLAERRTTRPADIAIGELLRRSGAAYVHDMWQKALARREQDPDGAITAARTLLEEVCRFILDEEGERYDENSMLPKLYTLTAKKLKLAPSQHTEDIVKRILGGCHSIVEGIGALRSKVGDAHAKGRTGAQSAPRHAAFAVNVAGAAASFILETYEARKKSGTLVPR